MFRPGSTLTVTGGRSATATASVPRAASATGAPRRRTGPSTSRRRPGSRRLRRTGTRRHRATVPDRRRRPSSPPARPDQRRFGGRTLSIWRRVVERADVQPERRSDGEHGNQGGDRLDRGAALGPLPRRNRSSDERDMDLPVMNSSHCQPIRRRTPLVIASPGALGGGCELLGSSNAASGGTPLSTRRRPSPSVVSRRSVGTGVIRGARKDARAVPPPPSSATDPVVSRIRFAASPCSALAGYSSSAIESIVCDAARVRRRRGRERADDAGGCDAHHRQADPRVGGVEVGLEHGAAGRGFVLKRSLRRFFVWLQQQSGTEESDEVRRGRGRERDSNPIGDEGPVEPAFESCR